MLSIVLYTRQEGKGLNGNSCTESHIRSGVFDRWEQERIIQGIWIAGFQNPMATICRNSQASKIAKAGAADGGVSASTRGDETCRAPDLGADAGGQRWVPALF